MHYRSLSVMSSESTWTGRDGKLLGMWKALVDSTTEPSKGTPLDNQKWNLKTLPKQELFPLSLYGHMFKEKLLRQEPGHWARQVRHTTCPHGDYIIVRNLPTTKKSKPKNKIVTHYNVHYKRNGVRNYLLWKKTCYSSPWTWYCTRVSRHLS